jgi:hypothetical protein
VDDVEEFHDGGSIVGDGGRALPVDDELVHAAWAQRRPGVGFMKKFWPKFDNYFGF